MLIGHQKIWEFLRKSAELGKLPHALLFSGQEKLGKKTLALEFVKSIFGQNLLNPPHPDFILVEPIKKDYNPPTALSSFARASIQISQIRDLIWKLSLKPFLAPFKAAIIDQAHLMNQEAQNCFLKTLEEPKGKTLLILVSEYPEMLFPTILSRVQKIKFYPVKKIEIENYLKNRAFTEKEVKEISEICLGRPGIAVDFLKNPQKLEIYKQKIKELIGLTNFDLASRFQYAKDLSKEDNLKEILNIWMFYFRNLLIKNENLQSQNKLINILKKFQNINFLISTTNVNPRLALEILMLEL